jgi:hypothetical protein
VQLETGRHDWGSVRDFRAGLDYCSAGGLTFQAVNEFINRH